MSAASVGAVGSGLGYEGEGDEDFGEHFCSLVLCFGLMEWVTVPVLLSPLYIALPFPKGQGRFIGKPNFGESDKNPFNTTDHKHCS